MWLLAFVTFWLGGAVWALGTPPLSAPDEGMHTIKAAGVWLGQFTGRATTAQAAFADPMPVPACYQFQPAVPADCSPGLQHGDELVETGTIMEAYPPLFYGLVGWATRLLPDANGLYLMRIVNAMVCSALLASALIVASEAGWWMIAGLALSISPAAVYYGAVVNPNGLEIASAIAFWVSLLAVIRSSSAGRLRTGTLVLTAVAGVSFANARPLSPLFVVIVLVTCLALAGRCRAQHLITSQAGRRVAALLFLGLVVSSAWILANDTLDTFVGSPSEELGMWDVLRSSFGETTPRLEQMIGEVGYLDTRAPSSVFIAWYAGIGTLLALTFAFGTRRQRLVLLGLTLFVVALPLALEARAAHKIGFVYQGRYGLPVAVGVPLVCGYVLSSGASLAGIARRVGVALLVTVSIGHLLMHYASLRRYTVGISPSSPIWFFGRERWHPAMPTGLLGLGGLLFSFAIVGVAWCAVERSRLGAA